jgi:hypothetical protein
VVVFDVAADSYARFMGRFSEPLAVQFAHLAGVHAGQRVLTAPSTPRWPSCAFHDRSRLRARGDGLAAGLQHIEPGSLTVEITFKTFTDWWEPSGQPVLTSAS